MSGSKTPLYILVVVMAMSHYMVRSRSLFSITLAACGLVACINLLTIGSTLDESIYYLASKILGDATFTGRTEIWALLMGYSADHPITGSGFLSFWQIGFVSPAMQYGSGWASTAAYGHQGYLDLAASIGIPGLALVLIFVLLRPCSDLAHVKRRNSPMLEMYVGFWLFGLLTNGTESSILARADQVWLFTVMGIVGIRRCLIESSNADQPPVYVSSLSTAPQLPVAKGA